MGGQWVVLVQGLATVRDADLQANTDRYVRLSLAKAPEMFRGQPRSLLRRFDWVLRPHLDPGDAHPRLVVAGKGLGPGTRRVGRSAGDHGAAIGSSAAGQAARRLARGARRLAVPVAGVEKVEQGFRLRLGRHLPGAPQGLACLTFHTHPATFTRQENHTFVGEVWNSGPDEYVFRVQRLLADVSLSGNKLANTLGFLAKGRRLAPRLEPEASRRGQPVPKVRHPRDHDLPNA